MIVRHLFFVAGDANFRCQAFRQAIRPWAAQWQPLGLSPLAIRLLSDTTRQAIDKAVASSPVVLFMKGTPETPQCGFSRASIEILGIQGVDPKKFAAFNVLESEELRQGTPHIQARTP
jgi:monothiol glutaredoxin